MSQDRESKLRDQVAALEEQIARLKAETSKPPVVAPTAITPAPNGYKFEQPSRSESRASTVYHPVATATAITPAENGYRFERPPRSESRASTVYLQSRSATPVNTKPARAQLASNGVWNSMHNPYRANGVSHRTPNGSGLSTPKRSGTSIRAPSPTASVVSTAPTVDEEGWWS